jgi:hypothetical protein
MFKIAPILLILLAGCQKAQPQAIVPPTADSTSAHHRFVFHGEKPDSLAFMEQSKNLDGTFGEFLMFFKTSKNPNIQVDVYPSYEAKALATNNQTCASVSASNKIAVVWSKESAFNCLDGASSIESRLIADYPNAEVPILHKGMGIYFTNNWRFKGYKHWAAKIYHAGFTPPLSQLLTAVPQRRNGFGERVYQPSTIVQQALLGAFIDFLIQEMRYPVFVRQYPDFSRTSLLALEDKFHAYLSQLPTQSVAPIPEPHKIQKGFNFAHEGYNITDGYMGSSAVKSIAKMDSLGVNAVAIVPYSFMRNPQTPNPFSIPQGAGGENDESVIFSALTSRSKGMSIMLKPQIWIRDSWPGAVQFDSDEKVAQFFKDYEIWIAHYALMAEMYDIEILCVATEFGKMTKGHEDKWIAMFEKIRKIYRGKLTVAAHWQGDFEHKPFWDALDYVGINLYKSLSENPNASDEALKTGAEALADLMILQAKTYQKPILLTETGFTATTASWKNPFEYADGKDLNIAHQTRAYSAFLKAMIERKAVQGIYLWKFPSYLSYGGIQDNDFTPNGKPAESIVKTWYERWSE